MNREQLIRQIKEKKSFLCVGLDPDMEKMPDCVKGEDDPVFAFNRQVIDATLPYAVAYKPNTAFYEAYGLKGMLSLKKTIDYLRDKEVCGGSTSSRSPTPNAATSETLPPAMPRLS